MQKLRVAIDTSYMDRRPAMGTAVFIRKLVEHLRPYRDEIDFTLVHREAIPEDPLYGEFKELIIPQLPLPKGKRFFSELWFFLTTKERFDVYHFSHNRVPPSFMLAPGRKKITMQWDGGPDTTGRNTDTKPNAFNYIWPLMRTWMDGFLVASEFGKQGLVRKQHLTPERVHVAYGAAEPIFTPRDDKEAIRDHLAKEYGLPHNFIVASGRLDPHKNILRLVQAYDILVKKYDVTLPLVITGGDHSPEYTKRVHDEISALGLTGKIFIVKLREFTEMPMVYNAATMMVFPTLYEGFGLPLSEAMACGIPTAASNSAALPEVGGDATRYFNPEDVEDMANVINEVLSNPELQTSLVQKGFEQVKKFTWEEHAQVTVALYRTLASA